MGKRSNGEGKIFKEYYITDIRFHDLRHTFATLPIKADGGSRFHCRHRRHQNIPGSKLMTLSCSVHGIMYDQLDKFNDIFMKSITNPGNP